MGCHANITKDKFPKQTGWVGKPVLVCFHYDLDASVPGTIVRDDEEAPFVTLIKLDDGRHVLGVECQYRMAPTRTHCPGCLGVDGCGC